MLKISKILLSGDFLLSIGFGYTYGWATELSYFFGLLACSIPPKYDWVNTILYTVINNGITSSVILIFTILMAISLFVSKKRRAILSESASTQSDKEFRMGVMVFIVACAFILLHIPTAISHEVFIYLASKDTSSQSIQESLIAYPISSFLRLINHSINFVIYMIFFKQFRDTFFSYCKCFIFKQSSPANEVSNLANISTRATQNCAK